MSKALFIAAFSITAAACSTSEAREAEKAKEAAALAASSTPRAPSTVTAPSGTIIHATIQEALSSRSNKSGESVRTTVSADVKDSRGNVVIPAGATLMLTIDKLEPGSDQVRPEGRLMLDVNSVTIRGEQVPLHGTLEPVAHALVGRGITRDEAARVAAGAAIGAGVGQVIGKNTKSTVIGGAVGAVAGGAVAARYAYRDVVVSAGTSVVITLSQSLIVSAR